MPAIARLVEHSEHYAGFVDEQRPADVTPHALDRPPRFLGEGSCFILCWQSHVSSSLQVEDSPVLGACQVFSLRAPFHATYKSNKDANPIPPALDVNVAKILELVLNSRH